MSPLPPFLTLAALLAVATAQAQRTTVDVPTYGAVDGGASVLLSNADGRSPYRGIVRYIGRAQCIAVFIAPVAGNLPPDAPAYALTNGHCADFPGSNDVIVNRPAPSTHRVVFDFFADAVTRRFEVPVGRIAYATMKGRDVAVLELAARYDDLLRSGFAPRPLAVEAPRAGDGVVVVGAPLFGGDNSFLRLAACRLDAPAEVVLEYVWHWFDSMRLGCADIRGGSSGSPVISRASGHVVGLLNTTTIGSGEHSRCFLDHPCEPLAGDVVSHRPTSYMTNIAGVDRCFDLRGRFNASRPGCPLDPGDQAAVAPGTLGAQNPRREAGLLSPPRQQWDAAVRGRFERYRYKVVEAARGDCRDIRGYGPVRLVADRPLVTDPLPRAEGYHFLCVIGVRGDGDEAAQHVEHPTIVSVRIDTIPPVIPARITLEELTISWRVSFGFVDPEISAYTYKFGRPGETRCDDPAGYRPALIPFISLLKANRPYVFCAIAHDSALNPGSPYEVLLP